MILSSSNGILPVFLMQDHLFWTFYFWLASYMHEDSFIIHPQHSFWTDSHLTILANSYDQNHMPTEITHSHLHQAKWPTMSLQSLLGFRNVFVKISKLISMTEDIKVILHFYYS